MVQSLTVSVTITIYNLLLIKLAFNKKNSFFCKYVISKYTKNKIKITNNNNNNNNQGYHINLSNQ